MSSCGGQSWACCWRLTASSPSSGPCHAPGHGGLRSGSSSCLAVALNRAFGLIQELLPCGFWVFWLAAEHPGAEQGEQGAGHGSHGLMWLHGWRWHRDQHGHHWRWLIRLCPWCSSCRRWETAAPWCDLQEGPNHWQWDGASPGSSSPIVSCCLSQPQDPWHWPEPPCDGDGASGAAPEELQHQMLFQTGSGNILCYFMPFCLPLLKDSIKTCV